MMRWLLALGGALALAGCANSERVTLLAPAQAEKAENNQVGGLVIRHGEEETYVTSPNLQAGLRGERRPRLRQLDETDPLHVDVMSGLPSEVVRESFYFGHGIEQLDEDELARLQEWLRAEIPNRPGLHIEIAAHADATGTEAANDTITQRRALNVLAQVRERIEAGEIEVDADDIDVVASSWHWARSLGISGADSRFRVVVVTIR